VEICSLEFTGNLSNRMPGKSVLEEVSHQRYFKKKKNQGRRRCPGKQSVAAADYCVVQEPEPKKPPKYGGLPIKHTRTRKQDLLSYNISPEPPTDMAY
jgi:hypothetical protein